MNLFKIVLGAQMNSFLNATEIVRCEKLNIQWVRENIWAPLSWNTWTKHYCQVKQALVITFSHCVSFTLQFVPVANKFEPKMSPMISGNLSLTLRDKCSNHNGHATLIVKSQIKNNRGKCFELIFYYNSFHRFQ